MVSEGEQGIEKGYNVSLLAWEMLQRFPGDAWLARVTSAVYGCVKSWRDPVHLCGPPLKRAFHVGLGTGDLEFALVRDVFPFAIRLIPQHCHTFS